MSRLEADCERYGTADMSCKTNATRRRGQRVEHDEQGEPDRLGHYHLTTVNPAPAASVSCALR